MSIETEAKIAEWRKRLEALPREAEWLKKEIEIRVGHIALMGFSMKLGTGKTSSNSWLVEIAAMRAYVGEIPAMQKILEGYITTAEKAAKESKHAE